MNAALEAGLQHEWWPDWRGRPAAIIASGWSTAKFPIDMLRGAVHVLAIKQNVDKAPWADVVYGCDDAWWLARKGLPEFTGLKLAYGNRATSELGIRKVSVAHVDKFLLDKPLHVGSGKNSGFQALNLVMQFGANPILLIGFDFNDRGGLHWYGRNGWKGANNPTGFNFQQWSRAMTGAALQARDMGFDIINASPGSDLKCFRPGGLRDLGLDAAALDIHRLRSA